MLSLSILLCERSLRSPAVEFTLGFFRERFSLNLLCLLESSFVSILSSKSSPWFLFVMSALKEIHYHNLRFHQQGVQLRRSHSQRVFSQQ